MEAENERDDMKYKCEKCYEHFFNSISLQLHVEEKHSSLQTVNWIVSQEPERSEKVFKYEDDNTDTNDSLVYQDNADDEDYDVENDEDDEEDDDIDDEDEDDIEDEDQASVVYTEYRRRSSQGVKVPILEKKSFKTETSEQHQCDVCHASFSSFISLQCHQAVHSVGEVPDKAEDSDTKAEDQSSSKVSNISKQKYTEGNLWETEEKPFKCDVCYESFSSSVLLEGHKVVHSIYRNPPKKSAEEKRFKCDVCQKKFRRGGDLEGHMRTHTGERPFECEFCDRAFKLKGDLKKHTYKHTGERPFPCDVCGKTFSRSYSLKLHQKTHKGSKNINKAMLLRCQNTNKPVRNPKISVVVVDSDEHISDEDSMQVYQSPMLAQQIGESTNEQENLGNDNDNYIEMEEEEQKEDGIDQSNEFETNDSHVLSEHPGQFHYECEICDKWYTDKNSLNDHMKKHSDEKPFQCGICKNAFSRVSDLTDHMLAHAEENSAQHQGPEALLVDMKEAEFSNSEEEKLSEDEEIKTFKCEFCDKTFVTKIIVFQAHRDTHTSDTPYECGLCEKSYRTRGTMLNHKKMHSNVKPIIECDICHQRFTKKHSLENHKRIHTGEKPFKCKFCNHEFRKRSALNVHLRLHTDGKNYKCGICGRAFVEQHILKGHMRVHTGEKPYFCKVCNKSFRIAAGLRIHTRIHTGEKPYTCNICDKSFVQLCSLMYHKQTHTEEKSFQCDDCEKYFSTKCYLHQHKKKYCSIRKLREAELLENQTE